MNTEEKSQNGDKAGSGCCGFDGSRMGAITAGCCTGEGGSTDCSTMMRSMMETMKKQSCCPPSSKNPGQEGKP